MVELGAQSLEEAAVAEKGGAPPPELSQRHRLPPRKDGWALGRGGAGGKRVLAAHVEGRGCALYRRIARVRLKIRPR